MCVRCKVKNLRNGVNLLVLDLLARDHHEALGPYLYHREAPCTSGLIGSRPGPSQGTLWFGSVYRFIRVMDHGSGRYVC